ncbi:MAG: LysM peptidoglycan-binding domain-containing protein [Alistipes sp.]|nr:LysM peptidoglycan-binding domain-containing protein [Alistipes sp.]
MKKSTIVIALLFALLVGVGMASAQEIVVVNGVKYRVHDVVKGETLYSLSRQYGVTVDEIIAANESLANGLKADTRIRIPLKGETQAGEVAVAPSAPAPAPAPQTAEQSTVAKSDKSAKGNKVRRRSPLADMIEGVIAAGKATANRRNESTRVTEEQPTASEVTPLESSKVATETPYSEVANAVPIAPTEQGVFRRLGRYDVAEVALLLPLGSTERPATNYIDFYRGFLIGLDSVRMAGYSVNLALHNTAHDYHRVESLLTEGALSDVDLVVGPVYEDELIPVATAMQERGVPVVSPLADLKHTSSGCVFQMSPSQQSKYDKVQNLFDGSHRVLIVSAEQIDTKFDAEVRGLLKSGLEVVEHKYIYEHPSIIEKREKEREKMRERGLQVDDTPSPSDLSPFMRGVKPTVVLVTAANEIDVDRILAAIAAASRSLSARSLPTVPFVVLGNNRWSRYTNIDRSTLFTTNVIMLSTYHARRTESLVKQFDTRFVQEFGAVPSRYAYRGYDAAVLFVRGLFESMDTAMEGIRQQPLLTPYRFERSSEGGVRVNNEWVKVMYHSNFTITNE